MRILFVGNSYTYYNKMPDTLAQIACAEGFGWQVESVTRGGWSFAQYADPENEMHAPLTETFSRKWDAVFLQEQSVLPVIDREKFLRGAADVCALLPQKPSRLFFYVTWGRRDGSDKLKELGMTRPEMTAALHDSYAEAAARNSAELSDAGGAFAYAMNSCPEVELYNPDLSHPSPAGSYLAALIHFRSLTGFLPDAVRTVPEGVSKETAEKLLSAARAFCEASR